MGEKFLDFTRIERTVSDEEWRARQAVTEKSFQNRKRMAPMHRVAGVWVWAPVSCPEKPQVKTSPKRTAQGKGATL